MCIEHSGNMFPSRHISLSGQHGLLRHMGHAICYYHFTVDNMLETCIQQQHHLADIAIISVYTCLTVHYVSKWSPGDDMNGLGKITKHLCLVCAPTQVLFWCLFPALRAPEYMHHLYLYDISFACFRPIVYSISDKTTWWITYHGIS